MIDQYIDIRCAEWNSLCEGSMSNSPGTFTDRYAYGLPGSSDFK